MVGWSRIATAMLVAACGRVGYDETPVGDAQGNGTDGGGDIDAMLPADAAVDAPPPPIDPTGSYAVAPAVVYSCALGLVDLNITALDLAMNGDTLEITGSPCLQTGTYDPATGAASATCTLPGTCDEIYTITGAFIDDVTLVGDFTASFVGQCLDCADQGFSVSLTRQ